MIIIRWFGLDTVGCVVAIQLFLSGYRETLDIFTLVGLSAAVSFVYMLDRYRDLKLAVNTNDRQLIYNDRFGLMILSMLILIGIAGFYWLNLDPWSQVTLFGCGVLVIAHLWLLGMDWYVYCKDLVVSLLFATVMMVGMYHLSYVWVLIALLTLFNLTVHRLIETGIQRIDGWLIGAVFIALILVLIINFGVHWMLLIWTGSMVAQLMLIRYSVHYWYEIGEIYFALPFLMAYIFNS